jgi:acyl carrier protein
MVRRRGTTRAARATVTPGLEEVKRHLRRLIEDNAGIPGAEVDDDSSVDLDLAMDSMSFLALQVAVEDAFAINCTPDEIMAANRFAAIAALVHDRAARAGRSTAPPARTVRRTASGRRATPPSAKRGTVKNRPRR